MIELTSRLTLSSCVSQLTDFYLTAIQDKFVEEGIQPVTITTCDESGEVLPFTIFLEPVGQSSAGNYKFQQVEANIYLNNESGRIKTSPIFNARLEKAGMNVRQVFQCALHLCGDYIKFYSKSN